MADAVGPLNTLSWPEIIEKGLFSNKLPRLLLGRAAFTPTSFQSPLAAECTTPAANTDYVEVDRMLLLQVCWEDCFPEERTHTTKPLCAAHVRSKYAINFF